MSKDTTTRNTLIMGLGLVALLLVSANLFTVVKQHFSPTVEHNIVIHEIGESPSHEMVIDIQRHQGRHHIVVERTATMERELERAFDDLERELARMERELDGITRHHEHAHRPHFVFKHKLSMGHPSTEQDNLDIELNQLERELEALDRSQFGLTFQDGQMKHRFQLRHIEEKHER